MAITPQFLFDLESNMRVITENEYVRFTRNSWWSKFMRVQPSKSKREIVHWLITSAQIRDLGKRPGSMSYEEMVSKYKEFDNRYAGDGLRVIKSEFDDLDGSGIDQATKWSGDIGAYMGYWPQKVLAKLIRNGDQTGNTTYDDLTYFHTAHLNHPLDSARGTFANLFTGAVNGAYPGALPIDSSVTLDVAAQNVGKAIAYIRGTVKMPNGEDPRFLKPKCLIVPPALSDRAQALTGAKFIAQAAASGGGSADVEAVVKSWQLDEPVVAEELGASYENGSDTSWYLACEELTSTQLGAFVYIDRDPFKITYHGVMDDVELDRADELEWLCKGRNGSGYGHPYAFYKAKAA
jgi:hypothetical protein